jgi:hypothetical protein
MLTLKRILREFWVPATLAIAWTAYSFYTRTGPWGVKEAITAFGPSFFLVSWTTGQFFRIQKQSAVEQNLRSIESRISGLVDSLEQKTSDLASHITGGDSFCVLQFMAHDLSRNVAQIVAIHHGEHTLYEVNARVVDGDCFEKAIATNQPISIDTCSRTLRIGTMTKRHAVMLETIQLRDRINLSVAVTALNGTTHQVTQLTRTPHGWAEASKVHRNGKVVYRRISDDFPMEAAAKEAW